jgi:hypothetical protein
LFSLTHECLISRHICKHRFLILSGHLEEILLLLLAGLLLMVVTFAFLPLKRRTTSLRIAWEGGTSTSAKAKGPLSIKGFSLLPFQARTPVRARASGSPFI